MMFRSKHLAILIGYHIQTDCRFGMTVALGARKLESYQPRYRLIVSFSFEWPRLVWAHNDWAINEPGCVRGLPIARSGMPLSRLNRLSRWTGRQYHLIGWSWPHYFSASRYD